MKATSYELELYQRLLQQDETASAELFDAYYEDLLKYFTKSFEKSIDIDTITDYVADSLFKLIDHPEKYNPEKGTLLKFLQGDIRGDILNFLNRKKLNLVEFDMNIRNSIYRQSSEEQLIDDELISKIKTKLQTWFTDTADFQLAWNIVCEERSTENYVTILSITHLPIEEQRKMVKRHKDRIKKQLERRGWQKFLKSLA